MDYYNSVPVTYDAGFLLSRLGLIAAGLLCVLITEKRFAALLRGAKASGKLGKARMAPVTTPDPLDTKPLATLGMRPGKVGFWSGAATVAAFELKELRSTPGLYLFVPIILLQIIGSAMFEVGAFDTPILLTSGFLAVQTLNTITLMVVFLLLFYTVESLRRERGTGIASIYYSSTVPTPRSPSRSHARSAGPFEPTQLRWAGGQTTRAWTSRTCPCRQVARDEALVAARAQKSGAVGSVEEVFANPYSRSNSALNCAATLGERRR